MKLENNLLCFIGEEFKKGYIKIKHRKIIRTTTDFLRIKLYEVTADVFLRCEQWRRSQLLSN